MMVFVLTEDANQHVVAIFEDPNSVRPGEFLPKDAVLSKQDNRVPPAHRAHKEIVRQWTSEMLGCTLTLRAYVVF